jgi:predicted XRE-type DNA-binding protein
MSNDDDDFELVYGSGNVFRDFNYPDADIRQAKCILAAAIIKILDERQWSIRRAEEETGVNHADFARIRNVNIGRFTLDRLMAILGKLGQEIELAVSVKPRQPQPNMHPAPVR